MLKSKLLLSVALPLALYSVAAEAKLYKWVDEKGETHYGEVIPPEYSGDKKVQIERGMEVQEKPKAATKEKPKDGAPQTQEEIERARHDKALLATYANEGEIDDQLRRSLQPVHARISGFEMQMKSAQSDLDGYLKEKNAAAAANRPVDKALQEQIDVATRRVNTLKDDVAAAKADEEKIKARFAADKARYRELMRQQSGE